MLKEGWDVKNVTTIVTKAFTAEANILPEQALGRGLRRMYMLWRIQEYVSTFSTPALQNLLKL